LPTAASPSSANRTVWPTAWAEFRGVLSVNVLPLIETIWWTSLVPVVALGTSTTSQASARAPVPSAEALATVSDVAPGAVAVATVVLAVPSRSSQLIRVSAAVVRLYRS